MGCFVTITFDLHGASSEDYQNAYAEFNRLGYSNTIYSRVGHEIRLPESTYVGHFPGLRSSRIRTEQADRVQKALERINLSASIFVVTGSKWAWGYRKARPFAKTKRLISRLLALRAGRED